ncbi:phosphotransferase [Microbacterium sp. H83]|uniref:phosphotransferase n=1 Tax=Microbacterium sp. H83 TaxID=1827324 RepID=UPI0007F4E446|nr:phosphotransferase [Microbacterium sp. H83]OAN41319.1 hypothetical protein A4X16_11620 [Microbacterium sp. H83]
MHDGELTITEATAARLIAQRFPALATAPLRTVHAPGTVNTIVRIGDDLAARFPRLPESESVLEAEAAAMRELAAASSVPTPRPYGLAAPASDYPSAWSVQTWIPGATAAHDSHAACASLAGDVAELIASLRAVDVGGRSFDGHGRGGDDLTAHDEWVEHCMGRSAHRLDPDRVRRLWHALRDLPPCGPDMMSHRDLTPFNLLVADDRLVGVLDGGAFGPADRALDLVAAWHLFDARRRLLVRERLDVRDAEWRRGAAWALQQAMGLVWYYELSNPAMSALGLSTMHRLLGDDELAAVR